MQIRKGVPEDIPAIEAIYNKVIEREERTVRSTCWTKGVYPTADTAANAIAHGWMYVLTENGRVLASAIINQEQLDIYADAPWSISAAPEEVLVLHTLAVDPEVARRGLGTRFLSFYAQLGRELGCRALRLDTNVLNLQGQSMYHKLGFTVVAEVPCVFNNIPGVSLLLLERDCSPIPLKAPELELFSGSPADYSGRLEKEQRCYRLLDSLGLEYWRCDHPAAETMEACLAVDRALGAMICKNLFLCNRQKTDFYLLMMPADKPFRTKELSGQLGCSRLSFASAEDMEQYLDITPGSVSILGLMNDHDHRVQLLVDADVLQDSFVGCHPCINTSSLKLHTADVFGPLVQALQHPYRTVKLTGES